MVKKFLYTLINTVSLLDHCGGGRSAGACIIYTVRAGTAGAWLYDSACHDREHGADVCD